MQRIKKILLDDESVVIGTNKLTDFRYMRILRAHMRLVGGWPGKEIGEKHTKYLGTFNTSQLVLSMILQWHYLKAFANMEHFYELVHLLVTWFICIVALSRAIIALLLPKYKDATAFFITKMHLFHYKNGSEYAMQTFKRVHFICHIYTICLTIQMLICLTMYNSIPMWKNVSAGNFKKIILTNTTYVHSVLLSAPLQQDTHLYGYLVYTLYNWYVSYLTSTTYCIMDLQLSIMVFNIWGHIKILLNDLESFPLPTNASDKNVKMYSKQELEVISQRLKQCIDRHRLIKEFVTKMSDAFGMILLIYYAYHQISGCLLLLICSELSKEELLQYLPLSVTVFQELIQVSIIFEMIGSTSEKLKDAVYGVPWLYMDTSNRRIVSIFLMNVQKPINVKALGVLVIGVTTMSTILRTSFSYFLFLRNFN